MCSSSSSSTHACIWTQLLTATISSSLAECQIYNSPKCCTDWWFVNSRNLQKENLMWSTLNQCWIVLFRQLFPVFWVLIQFRESLWTFFHLYVCSNGVAGGRAHNQKKVFFFLISVVCHVRVLLFVHILALKFPIWFLIGIWLISILHNRYLKVFYYPRRRIYLCCNTFNFKELSTIAQKKYWKKRFLSSFSAEH